LCREGLVVFVTCLLMPGDVKPTWVGSLLSETGRLVGYWYWWCVRSDAKLTGHFSLAWIY